MSRPGRLHEDGYRALRAQVLARDRWTCQMCGSKQQLDVHHIIPRSRAGADCERNLITLCRTCHAGIHSTCAML